MATSSRPPDQAPVSANGGPHTVDAQFSDHHGRRWWILAVLCTSLMIIIVGNTALNIALPTLANDLRASARQLQWMVDAYGLVFAGLLFAAGAIGDRYGRKGALQAGLLVFLGGSLIAAFGTGATTIIVSRAIMGIGAAFVMPSTLSILANVFPPHERAKAIAVWAGISGGGAAIGPIASGFLLRHYWWGSVFLVNVPIIVVALVAGQLLVPTSRDPNEARLDVLGALLSIATMVTLVYAIIEAPDRGWASATTLLRFGAAIVLGALFILWERRTSAPMLDLHLFHDRRFSVASGSMTLIFFAMFGVFFLMTQYFQLVLHYNTLTAGLSQGPFALVMMLVAPQSPKLVTRFGGARVVACGLAGVAVGLVFMTFIMQTDSHYWQLLPIFVTLPAGMALTMSPLTASIMSAVPLGRAGVGSAMNDTTRELGGALGVAVLGSLVASRFASRMSAITAPLARQARATARAGLANALEVSRSLGGEQARNLANAARRSYVSGLHLATLTGACAAIVASVVVYNLLPHQRGGHAPVTSARDAEMAGAGD